MTSPDTGASKLIGRQQELAVLSGALEDTLSGKGRVVMLAGEPGIGKTRLAHELTALAEARGASVLWGWCHEHRGAPPYWPWLQSIRAYMETAESSQLSQDMGPGAADISEILPELTAKLEGLEKPPALDQEQARFRLFFSITTFFKNISRRSPLVLVLDDLHWADESSLLLLEFLAREISTSPLIVVGTYRDVEITGSNPLAMTLGSLVREENFQRIQLSGLSRQEVGEFIEARAGVAVAGAAIDSLHQRTEGNPQFVGEVVSSVGPEEMTQNQDWIASIPEAVRETILRRLGLLSNSCNQLLRTASVIGRDFDFPLLRALSSDISEQEFLGGLDQAMSIRIVETVPSGSRRYRFGHALIQQAVYEEIPRMQRAQTHARVGETLEELHRLDRDDHAGELAHHFSEAEAVIGNEKSAHYSLIAGERALATYAREDSIAHFERGLISRGIALSGAEIAPDGEAAALLFGLARARSGEGIGHQLVEAFNTLSRAFEYYSASGDVAMAVAAAEFPISNPAAVIPGAAQLMARALGLVPADSHEAGRLLSRYGGILGVAGNDYEGAQQALGQAITIAKREGDVLLEVQTLTYAAAVNGQHLRPQESIDNGLRAIELATGDENSFSYTASRRWTALSFIYLGDPNGARAHALELRDQAEKRSTSRVFVGRSLSPITYLSCLEGNWEAGREYIDQGLEASPLEMTLLATRSLLEHETGESAEGRKYLERLLESLTRTGPGQSYVSLWAAMAITAIARITSHLDRLEIAVASADAILSNQSTNPRTAIECRAALAMSCVQQGDESAAAEHYSYLLAQRGTMIYTFSSVDRLLGLLSHTIGNKDRALTHFEDALTFCRKAGYRPEMAWTCCDYADMLIDRNGPGDRAKAITLFDESMSIANELGMRPLMERVVAHRERTDAQPARTPAFPDGLTQREVEVLQLISSGRTDREIGKDLFISINTVGNHVRSILGKTNSANRTEAATYAARHGIGSDEASVDG